MSREREIRDGVRVEKERVENASGEGVRVGKECE